MTGGRTRGRLLGGTAAILLAAVGCTGITDGTAAPDVDDAPAFRTSVALSLSSSAVTSSRRAADRAAAETTRAVHGACESMSTTSAEAISRVNTYIAARNGDGDVQAGRQPSIEAFRHSADLVARALTPAVTGSLREALTAWVVSARAVADNIANDVDPATFNTSVTELNTSRDRALELCDAAYR